MTGGHPADDSPLWLVSLARLVTGLLVLARAARLASGSTRGHAAYLAVLGGRQAVQGGARVAGGPTGRTLADALDRIADPGHLATMLPVALSRRHRRFALRAAAASATWWLLDRAARAARRRR